MTIGFIGFGEAGSTIGGGLRAAGAGLLAFDINTHDAERGTLIVQRAAAAQARLAASSAELAAGSRIILSMVTSSEALNAARQTAPFLGADHLYADLNSVSPDLKREIAEVITASGARFIEVAVMAPVAPYAHRVPMLLGGPAAAAFADAMAPYGMRLDVLDGAAIGSAAAVKMCRSVVVKGLEALMCECVLGAGRYDADGYVFASLQESFPGLDWKKLADYMVGRVVVHGERRAREMEEVAETLRAAGVEPIMTEATVRRQDAIAALGLRRIFGPAGPATYREVLDAPKVRLKPDTTPAGST